MLLNKRIYILILALACVSISGCRNVRSSGISIESHYPRYIRRGYKVLDKHVTIVDYSKGMRNGLMAVTVVGQNRTDKDLQCEYRFTWYDGDGLDIETGMSLWKPALFHGKARVNMSAIAPSKNVKDYKLVLRFRQSSVRF